MKYDVFISYSSKDSDSAKRICSLCENNKIKCFLAERDIPRGEIWAPFIVKAIGSSSVMVALFSDNYNLSVEVDREITLASMKHIPILVYRIDMSEFEGTKAYYFSNINWYSPLSEESGDEAFIRSICSLLAMGDSKKSIPTESTINESKLIEPSIIAANNGDAEAQFYLGCYFEEKKDSIRSLSWYRKAADSGIAEASYKISFAILKNGAKEDYPKEGLINAEKAYNAGIPFAGLILAYCYIYGKEVIQDYQKGLNYLNDFFATSTDEPMSLGMAYYLLGNYYRFGWGNTPVDIVKAISCWEKSAEYNNPDAIYNLGTSFLNGDGVEKNESLAFSYFQRGVDIQDVKCYMGMALCYRRGIYVKKDLKKAIELYNFAAELGESEAYACLGALYLANDGIPVNEVEAAKWFLRGVQLGNTTSQHYLGIMYFNGQGVPKNQTEGVRLLQLAAKKGHIDSIMALKKLGLL